MTPVVEADNGYGLAVTIVDDGMGFPMIIAENGYGLPVVVVESGGLPVNIEGYEAPE